MGGGKWSQPSSEANHWELFAFFVMLDVFPDLLRNRFVVIRSDSMCACKCVRDLHAGVDCVELAHLTRAVLSKCVVLNCRLVPLHILGVDNTLADPLSRGDWQRFGQCACTWVRKHSGGGSQILESL